MCRRLLVLVTVSFFIIRLAPGSPFDQEQALSPGVRANLDAAFGLDQPLLTQYGRYLAGLARGDLGPSFRYKDFRVTELIADGLPLSLTIGLAAALLAFLVGVPLGAWAAWRANSWSDRALMGGALLGVVLPGFVVGPVLALAVRHLLAHLPYRGIRAVEPELPRAAGGHARAAGGGVHGAPDAHEHARSPAVELRAHRARERVADPRRAACATRCGRP